MKFGAIDGVPSGGEEILESRGALVVVVPEDLDGRVHGLHRQGVLGDALGVALRGGAFSIESSCFVVNGLIADSITD